MATRGPVKPPGDNVPGHTVAENNALGEHVSGNNALGDNGPPAMGLTVFYDAHCGLCQACARWLLNAPTYVPVRVIAAQSAAARERVPLPWLGRELIVAHDDGRFWVGPAAFIVCLWALQGYRSLASALSSPSLGWLSLLLLRFVSAKRQWIGSLMGHSCTGACAGGRVYR